MCAGAFDFAGLEGTFHVTATWLLPHVLLGLKASAGNLEGREGYAGPQNLSIEPLSLSLGLVLWHGPRRRYRLLGLSGLSQERGFRIGLL